MSFNPPTGDTGINPIIIILLIVCSVMLIGCIIWTIVLNHKNSKAKSTVVTVTEDDMVETTIVEDISSENDENPDISE